MSKKMNEKYKQALEQAFQELSDQIDKEESLQLELDTVRGKISNLRDALDGLGKLCGIDPEKERPDLYPEFVEPELGFTDAVREVFRTTDVPVIFDPVSVRNVLQERGFPLSKYKSPLASIHTILKRLVEQDELSTYEIDDKIHYGLPSKEMAKKLK